MQSPAARVAHLALGEPIRTDNSADELKPASPPEILITLHPMSLLRTWSGPRFILNQVEYPTLQPSKFNIMRLTIDDFKIQAKFPTHWGDEDSANHINNLVYLKWAETVRVHYFEAMGMDFSFSGDVAGPILAWQDCKYVFPMTHPDVAIVGSRCVEIQEDRFIIETGIFSEKHGRIVAITKQSIVPYNYGLLKKVAMPEAWKEGIAGVEGE